jgi:hypothetical protein
VSALLGEEVLKGKLCASRINVNGEGDSTAEQTGDVDAIDADLIKL